MNKSALFLTEVDIHHPRPLMGKTLRAYIILHALFFDELITGDSQFNNNPYLRSLIGSDESTEHIAQQCPRDLSCFLEEGYLLPAIRKEYRSLNDLRLEHLARNVDNVPSERYIRFVEECLSGQRKTYDGDVVSTIFRNRVLDAFSSQENIGRGKLSRQTAKRVHDYVANQEKLLYKSLRDWALQEVRNGKLTEREYHRIDRIVAGCYRHNVALSLNTNLDIPTSPLRAIYPFSILLGKNELFYAAGQKRKDWELSPKVFLSHEILSTIPAEALVQIKGTKKTQPSHHYNTLVQSLERFRQGKNINIEDVVGSLEEYLAEVELIFRDYLSSKHRGEYMAQKQKAKQKAIVKVIVDGIVTLLGFIPYMGNAISLIYAGFGAYRDLREVSKQQDLIHGYLMGRATDERLFRIENGG